MGSLSGGDNSNSNQVVVNQPMDQTNSTMQFTESANDNSMAINQMNNNLMLENNDLGSIQNSNDMRQQTQNLQLNDLQNNQSIGQQVKIEMENGQVVVVDSSQIENVTLVQQSQQLQHTYNEQSNQFGQQQQVDVSLSNQLMVNSNGTVSNMVDSSLIGLEGGDQLDEDQLEEENNDEVNLKEIDKFDDSLAMSPCGFGSLSGIGSSPYTMNGSNVSTHTFRKTEWDVKKLENYVRLSFGDATPMENMEPAQMNRYLVSFFKLAKKSDGMDYEPESLIGFMNSFERYLKTKNYPESLLRSETFKESRTELKKKRDLVRSIGKLIRTKTKDTCYLLQFHRNLLKEKSLLSRDNPDCLLAEIYLNNMIYFGEFLKEDKAWRGNLNLVWGDMLLERDTQNGVEYLTLATYAKKSQRNQQAIPGAAKTTSRTKTGTQTSKLRAAAAAAAANAANQTNNNMGVDSTNSPRVYARQPASYCPIEAYKIYRTRRPNNCLDRDSPFYLAPLFKSKNQSKVWYKALAMSCQRLDALFYCLFKKAGVDLASLASMSQQQQQQAVAAAASALNNPAGVTNENLSIQGSHINITSENIVGGVQNISSNQNSSSLAQWKAVMKENNNQLPEDMNDMLLNGKHIGDVSNVTGYHGAATFYTNTQPINTQSVNTASTQSTTTNQITQGTTQSNNNIVTTVPAQIQVQVQVQVQLPQHQQQQHIGSNVNTGLLV